RCRARSQLRRARHGLQPRRAAGLLEHDGAARAPCGFRGSGPPAPGHRIAARRPRPGVLLQRVPRRRGVVSAALPLLLVAASVAALLAAMVAIGFAGRRWNWSAEVQRKSVHVLVGVFAM